jgi:hypothetical protein
VSEPIKTQFGYHLIRVDKHEVPTMATVRAQIDDRVKPDQARQAVESLAKNTPVVMEESYFGPPAPPPAPPVGASSGPAAPATPSEPPPAPGKPATAKPKAPASKPAAAPKTAPAK